MIRNLSDHQLFRKCSNLFVPRFQLLSNYGVSLFVFDGHSFGNSFLLNQMFCILGGMNKSTTVREHRQNERTDKKRDEQSAHAQHSASRVSPCNRELRTLALNASCLAAPPM